MTRTKAMLLGGMAAFLAATANGQAPGQGGARPASPGQTVVALGSIQWLEESEVSALREGVIKSMEFRVGARVSEGTVIGSLHDELAKLSVLKAEVQARAEGPYKEAKAQLDLAVANRARLENLVRRAPGSVTKEELDKSDAEIQVSDARITSAKEQTEIAKAELDLQRRVVEEHLVKAPFSGVITERLKDPGEAVRANEPVVHLGRTDKLEFTGYLPLETALTIQPGMAVDLVPIIEGADLPIEHQRFRGKVTSISQQATVLRGTEVQVRAEIDNPPQADSRLELRQGLKAEMTIYLEGGGPARVSANTLPAAR
jgi:RND family efflux transporter MFP subunit